MKLFPYSFFPLVLCLVHVCSWCQKNPIEDYVIPTGDDLVFQGCVESISVKRIHYYGFNETSKTWNRSIETLYKTYFSKGGKRTKRFDYEKSFEEEPYQSINYDSLERISLLERDDHFDSTLTVKPFYNSYSVHPDSVIFLWGNTLHEQYNNYFIDTLVHKQEHYFRDTLRTVKIFEYDGLNRLIRKINVNTKNGWGIILDKSITGNQSEKSLYPNDTVTYKYSTIGDTLVVSEYRKRGLKKTSKKVLTEGHELLIDENYNYNSEIQNKVIQEVSNDTTVFTFLYNTNPIEESTSIHTPNRIILKRKPSGKIETTRIETEKDHRDNWIKKSYIKNGLVEKVILRELTYHCKE